MTSKLSWIFFVPFTLAAIALKAIQLVMPSENDAYFFGLSGMMLNFIALGCIVAVFLFALIFCLVDRKISPYYITGRNIAAGIFALLAAILIAADGAYEIFNAFSSGDFKVLPMLEMGFSVLGAIAMIVLGLSLFSQKSDAKKLALFYLLPAFFFAVRLINSFVGITTVSIKIADVTVLAVYIFMTMFWFNYSVMLSLTEAKNAVKSTMIYGFPAAAAGLCYGIYELMKNFSLAEPLVMLPAVEVLMISFFILAILIEITAKAKKREEVNIRGLKKNREKEEEEELLKNPPEENIEGFVINSKIENLEELEPSEYLKDTDTEGYLYQEFKKEPKEFPDNTDIPPLEESSEDYILEKTEDAYADEDKKNKTPSYMSRLDEIDKLILEISEEN
ncbi:MAG: hypothetical protein IJH32_05910 [Ruminococcus sp.]|nr:hypothetical protein [Ruminococcus sp.]